MENTDTGKGKAIILMLIIIVLTAALPILSYLTNNIIIFNGLSNAINKQIAYQSFTLAIAVVFICLLSITRDKSFRTYFRKGNISASILPEPIVGINPKPTENWLQFGRNFAVIISIVTAIVIYFQLIKNSSVSIVPVLKVLPFSLLFALVNSFVEESVTRFGVVVALDGVFSNKVIPFISAAIFGSVHYFGNPGGITGVLVAGFLGWLLCKSILEIKGIFWAWFIHFLQDVIIFSAILSV